MDVLLVSASGILSCLEKRFPSGAGEANWPDNLYVLRYPIGILRLLTPSCGIAEVVYKLGAYGC